MNKDLFYKVFKALLLSTSEGLRVEEVNAALKRHRSALEKDLEAAQEGEKDDILAQIGDLPESVDAEMLADAVQYINEDLEQTQDVYEIIESPEGYRIMIKGQWGKWVKHLRGDDKPMRISGAAMEVLALVAYRQPVTRAEMEMVRGVSVDSALNKLIDLELVHVVGQSSMPGKPKLFGTTDKFLEFCGVGAIEDLPASDVLPKDKLDEMVKDANKRERYREQELGFASEEGQEEPQGDAEAVVEEASGSDVQEDAPQSQEESTQA